MNNNQIVVPEIPEECRDKTFGPTDIKWVKPVTDDRSRSAYLLPYDNRVIANSKGIFFCLELKSQFEDSLNKVPIGGIILLYQRINPRDTKYTKYPSYTKCFTHLVTPIGNNVIASPYQGNWPGRWVQVIAMTGNHANNSIPFEKTSWRNAGFVGQWQDLSFQQGRVWEIPYIPQLSALQNEIWNKFQPWRKV